MNRERTIEKVAEWLYCSYSNAALPDWKIALTLPEKRQECERFRQEAQEFYSLIQPPEVRTDKVEEVKKILRRDRGSCRTVDGYLKLLESDAKEICQLFSQPEVKEPIPIPQQVANQKALGKLVD